MTIFLIYKLSGQELDNMLKWGIVLTNLLNRMATNRLDTEDLLEMEETDPKIPPQPKLADADYAVDVDDVCTKLKGQVRQVQSSNN